MSPADRTLAQRLAQLHRDTGLTGIAFAARLGWGRTKLSKILNGQQRPRPAEIEQIAAAAGHPELAAGLVAQLEDEQHRHRQWRGVLRQGDAPVQDEWDRRVRAAQSYRTVSPVVIPSMFQTAEYAAAIIGQGARIFGTADVGAAVAARMRRQGVLWAADRPLMEIVTTEAALALPPCPRPVMAAQLAHLSQVLQLHLPMLTVGIIPFGTELDRSPTTDFSIVDGRVFVETAGGSGEPGPEEAADYAAMFAELLAEAVTDPDGVLVLIGAWQARYGGPPAAGA